MFKCPYCNNEDERFIGYINDKPYCRKCIRFNKKDYLLSRKTKEKEININLKYPLSSFQKGISDDLVNDIEKYDHLLVYAVCGAGKTEIIVEVIAKFLRKGAKVGVVIPRRDLVIELGKRISDIFNDVKVTLVYGGHNKDLNGDIIILTSHQAFRYNCYFDLLIIDEIDAFPYANDEVLKNFVLNSSKGKIISLSATPSNQDLENNKVYTLFKRYHNNPLPIPKIIKSCSFFLLKFLIKKTKEYINNQKYVFIYVPSIKEGYKLHKYLNKYFNNIFVYSSIDNKEEIMKNIRNKSHRVIITTTILERGVTYKDLQVFVYKANEYIFDKQTLIQIAGRVGRTIDCPSGDVYFLTSKVTQEIKEAIKEIKKYNAM